jgi:ubiquinone/menaquinone biosynthesis C-methylase UbiE
MPDNWKDIWAIKGVDQTETDVLTALISANGFDVGPGSFSSKEWITMVSDFVKRAKITSNMKILEVGCGSGAFLSAVKLLTGASIYGYDFSESLITDASHHVDGEFLVSEASNNPFDITFSGVISHSVFQYFPNLDYAKNVIDAMVKAVGTQGFIALLDLNDIKYQDEYSSIRRLSYSDPKEYDEKYSSLEHTFYDKEMVSEYLKGKGFKHIEIYHNTNLTYLNAGFRFNLIAKRLSSSI